MFTFFFVFVCLTELLVADRGGRDFQLVVHVSGVRTPIRNSTDEAFLLSGADRAAQGDLSINRDDLHVLSVHGHGFLSDNVFALSGCCAAVALGIAEAGEVFFTESVYLSMNKNEVPSSEIGYRQFKGIADKIKLYKVLREDPVSPENPADTESTSETPKKKEGQPARPEPESAPETEKDKNSAGLAGLITGMLGKFGMKNINIEENGKNGPTKVNINNGEIHIVGNGEEIHIGKEGVNIRKIKKDGRQPPK